MEITAKDVYIFADLCLEIQKTNIEELKKWVADPAVPYKNKKIYKQQIKYAEEKLDFLENTKTIVEALYEKSGQALKIEDEDRDAIKAAYFGEAK